MPFPFKTDTEQARRFVLAYLELTKTEPDLFDGWRRMGMVVAFRLEDLGLDFTLDCTSGEDIVIRPGYPAETPGAVLKLSSDLFHDLFTGRANVGIAFARRQVRTEGNIAGVLRLTALMPRNIRLYKSYLQQQGVS